MKLSTKVKISTKLYGVDLYTSRMEWTKKTIESLPKGYKVLDAGAGECKNKAFCNNFEYVAQDFCEAKGTEANEDKSLATPSDNTYSTWDTSHIDIVSDIIDIPVDDASFDAVICTSVFEHIPYPELAVKEFSRITKSGGKLIITAPCFCGCHMAPYFYYDGLSEYWYRDILSKYGYEIEVLEKNGTYFKNISEWILMTKQVVAFYGKNKVKMSFIDRMIMLYAAWICIKYEKKTVGSENYITDSVMLVAKKK